MKDNKIVAVFIDADNAPYRKIDFIINELANYGSVMIRHIYGNWKKENLKGWENVLLDYALTPKQQFDYSSGKNATDMAMTIDVMDLLSSGKIDIFAIVSSDCDFTPLAMRIKAEGKQVIGFGEKKTPKSLAAACNKFLFLEDEPLFDNNTSGVNQDKNTSIRKTGNELKMDTALMNLLRSAIADCSDEDGWAHVGRVGSVISNQSSFDSKNYGYAKLSSLLRAIDIFEIKSGENQSALFVKNKRKKS